MIGSDEEALAIEVRAPLLAGIAGGETLRGSFLGVGESGDAGKEGKDGFHFCEIFWF